MLKNIPLDKKERCMVSARSFFVLHLANIG